MVSHQSTQLAQIKVVVSQQAAQLRHLQVGTAATPSPTPSGGGNSAGTSQPGSGGHYLSALSPTVDNGGAGTGQQVMAARSYPYTLSFYCNGPNGDQPDEAYDVAGSTSFSAVIGIPDNSSDVTDVVATVTFTTETNQRIGKAVQVSLGHPARVSLNITGVTQLGVSCTGRNAGTGQTANGFQVALGNARIY
jgi:hypothetical protein